MFGMHGVRLHLVEVLFICASVFSCAASRSVLTLTRAILEILAFSRRIAMASSCMRSCSCIYSAAATNAVVAEGGGEGLHASNGYD
jgi:hypothetical protein